MENETEKKSEPTTAPKPVVTTVSEPIESKTVNSVYTPKPSNGGIQLEKTDSFQDNQASGASPDDLTKPRHTRGVSWDQKIPSDQPRTPPRSLLLQPQLSDASADDSPRRPKSQLPPRFPQKSLKNLLVSTSTRQLNLGNMDEVEPLEREAENFLMELESESAFMKALEDRDPMGSGTSSGNSVLSGVPLEHLQHNFSNDNAPHSPKPMRSRLGSADKSMRSRLGSADKSTRFRLGSADKSTRFRLGSADVKMKQHRRQLTVEESLFGLSSALSAIQHVAAHQNNGTVEPASIGSRERSDTAGSTDLLVETADKLLNRAGKSMRNLMGGKSTRNLVGGKSTRNLGSEEGILTDQSASTGNGSPSNHWQLAKEKFIYKKTDVPQDQQVSSKGSIVLDLEKGVASDAIEECSDEDRDEEADQSTSTRGRRKNRKYNPFAHLPYAETVKNEWDAFNIFLRPRKSTIYSYSKMVLFYIWLPALGVASLLYHIFENPPTGRNPPIDPDKASASWWIIFICIREVFLFLMAKCTEGFIIDYLSLQTRTTLRLCGPLITLLIVQSKGWPFVLFFWGLYNFALVTGSMPFSNHWLFWQDLWGLFNSHNPAGTVTSSLWFYRVCAVAVGMGAAVAVKRLAVGIVLGRQTFANYSQNLAKVMNKMLDLTEVATLAKEIEAKSWSDQRKSKRSSEESPETREVAGEFSTDNLVGLIASTKEENTGDDASFTDAATTGRSLKSIERNERVIDSDDVNPYTGRLTYSQRARIAELLGRWEEPARGLAEANNISISSVLQFRRALAHMDTDFPFSAAFGLADTREACIASAQDVYDKLMMKERTINGELHFDTIAVLAIRRNGDFDNDRAKDLIRTFRPDRDGGISMVEFVRSVDNVYKELRMLRATVASSSKIDQAVEKIFNIAFYVLLVCVILAGTGFDPLALFLSMSSIILAFAFMIGSASSKYFEGILFILVQRPYGIGDRISVSNSEVESNPGGAQGWIVENVTLFTTTVYLAGTNEKATVSNGSLAKSRIINCARSPKALVTVSMRFSLETPYKKVEIFKSAVEKFVQSRPREWIAMLGFRANKIEADLGFTEFGIVLQHRERWQNIGAILNSKHTIHCYCIELAKKLDMRYKSPPLPIDLNMVGKTAQPSEIKYNWEDTMKGQSTTSELRSDMSLSPRSTSIIDDSSDLHGIAAMFDLK